jgi:hypothetical protein
LIKVTCKVEAYDEPAKSSITVHSHWYDSSKVEIVIGEEIRTVLARDLIAAVNNCTNTARF